MTTTERIANAARAYQAHQKGDPISDADLADAIAVLSETRDVLSALGPAFRFPLVDLIHTVHAFEGYQQARRRR